jgi:GDP-mannose 6-dehydrogenase
MKISVFGLGYVGCVSCACFARAGHDVWGVDVNRSKVDLINDGKSPIAEPGIPELICQVVRRRKLRATTDSAEAVLASDVSFICVGTPSTADGDVDLAAVRRACAEIGNALRRKRERHIVVVRSTMLPGTFESVVIPTLELYSHGKAGRDFDVCVNPEFLREGTSLQDFFSPPFTVIGADDQKVVALMSQLYASVDAPVVVVDVMTAEIIKYACNCFHALKISFANEIGSICKALRIDSHEVMELFCRDTKLNLSSEYLKPGFAFGGSCLPKDLRAITYKAKELRVGVPLLSSVLDSNSLQIERTVEMVLGTRKRRVGLLGLSFKPGTDDLRESPAVSLIGKLISNGITVVVYDPDISLANLVGANKEYIERAVPGISQLVRESLGQVLEEAEILVVTKRMDEFDGVASRLREDQVLIDLVRLSKRKTSGSYQGICW